MYLSKKMIVILHYVCIFTYTSLFDDDLSDFANEIRVVFWIGRPLEVRRFLNKIRRSIPINYRNKADRKGGIINDFISFGSILQLLKVGHSI